MPPSRPADTDQTTVFLLHFLGGSSRTWTEVAELLTPHARCIALNLPGFGNAARQTGFAVTEMADAVEAAIRAAAPVRWVLVGHSMGCKVAAVVARRMATRDSGPAGMVLISGSPPCPEPMSDEKRQSMLQWFAGDARSDQAEAGGYIDTAAGEPIAPDRRRRAVEDVLRADRHAWQAWLDAGSREDWADRIGTMDMPALIIAGTKDSDLGPDAQRRSMLPHFSQARLVEVQGAGHLLPITRPHEAARLIETFLADLASALPAFSTYRDLIASRRVSTQTRALLLERAAPDDPAYAPVALDAAQLATLRAVVDRVIPQSGVKIDLAARIDRDLSRGLGDGWRFATLPPDIAAYRAALRTLDAATGHLFTALDEPVQDELLTRVAGGTLDIAGADRLGAAQMKHWFEDVCSDAVRRYVSHPATLARMGYGGFANGGDGTPKTGFRLLGAGEREAWEPVAEESAP